MSMHSTSKHASLRQPSARPSADKARAPEHARGGDKPAPVATSTYRTWGLRRRAEPMEVYDPGRYPFIARVRDHLGLELIEVKGEGEPIQVALGQPRNVDDPDANAQRVTPFFSSLESLDYFCRLNLQTYLAVDDRSHLPRRWFWQETARASRAPSGGGSIVNEATVSTRRG
ncbi:MAG: hypothetical protein AB7P21_18870 [Lautropia sp.]